MIEKNRRGISTFIATLLLMVLAVSAGVVIYAYTMGYLGGFGGPETMGAMSLDVASATAGGSLTATVRNIGKVKLEIAQIYVEGTAVTSFTKTPTEFGEGTTCVVTTTPTPAFAASTTYNIKLVCKDNTQLSFSVKAK